MKLRKREAEDLGKKRQGTPVVSLLETAFSSQLLFSPAASYAEARIYRYPRNTLKM
jgi:hypothetical protein